MKESFRQFFKKEWRVPYSDKAMRVIGAFTLTEKVIFYFFVAVFSFSALTLLWQVNKSLLVEVPDYGGSLTEGIIGSPRFVNPLLAISDADRDLSSLIYSGLLKVTPQNTLAPDLAESYTISDDNLTYTFVIKKNAEFQDGTPVTADDVVFTIEKAKDANLKSPRKTNWDGVTVKKVDDRTIQFILKQPYSPFIQNATFGILPKHIWKTATNDEFPFSEYNIKAVGSGPYQVDSISYSSGGLPSEYHLTAFKKYVSGEPYITSLVIKSYEGEKQMIDAYNNGDIESVHGISPDNIKSLNTGGQDLTSPLPRVFGVFFNQNTAPVFVNAEVRQALDMVTDKQAIVDAVLGGYGQPANEPVPPKTLGPKTPLPFDEAGQLAKAQALLAAKGWKKNIVNGLLQKTDAKKNVTTLSFSISTGDAPELKKTAEMLQAQWQKLGAQVDVKIFEVSDLNQNIIRPRKYDALLFGEVIGRDMDLYPFWHSSERVDPGLNIALYTNIKADKILESIRQTSDPTEQKTLYQNFNDQVSADTPAVFLYSPYFIYVIPTKVHNIQIGEITTPAERFSDIGEWYIETNHIWSIFTH